MEITNFQKDMVEATTGVIYRLLTNMPMSEDEADRILKGFVRGREKPRTWFDHETGFSVERSRRIQ
jgi:hypothetical protein